MGCAHSSDSPCPKKIINQSCGQCPIGIMKISIKKVMLESLKQNLEYKNHLIFRIRIGKMIEERTIEEMAQNPEKRLFSFFANKCCMPYGRALTLQISNFQTNNLAIGNIDLQQFVLKSNKWFNKKILVNYGQRQAGFIGISVKFIRLPYTKYALSIGYTLLRDYKESSDKTQKIYAKIKLGEQEIIANPILETRRNNQVQQILEIISPFGNPQPVKISIEKTTRIAKGTILGETQFNIDEQTSKLTLYGKQNYGSMSLFLEKGKDIVGEILIYLKKLSEHDTQYFNIPEEIVENQTTARSSLNFSSIYSMNEIDFYIGGKPGYPGQVNDGFLCYSGRTQHRGKSLPASKILTVLKQIDPKNKKPRKLRDI